MPASTDLEDVCNAALPHLSVSDEDRLQATIGILKTVHAKVMTGDDAVGVLHRLWILINRFVAEGVKNAGRMMDVHDDHKFLAIQTICDGADQELAQWPTRAVQTIQDAPSARSRLLVTSVVGLTGEAAIAPEVERPAGALRVLEIVPAMRDTIQGMIQDYLRSRNGAMSQLTAKVVSDTNPDVLIGAMEGFLNKSINTSADHVQYLLHTCIRALTSLSKLDDARNGAMSACQRDLRHFELYPVPQYIEQRLSSIHNLAYDNLAEMRLYVTCMHVFDPTYILTGNVQDVVNDVNHVIGQCDPVDAWARLGNAILSSVAGPPGHVPAPMPEAGTSGVSDAPRLTSPFSLAAQLSQPVAGFASGTGASGTPAHQPPASIWPALAGVMVAAGLLFGYLTSQDGAGGAEGFAQPVAPPGPDRRQASDGATSPLLRALQGLQAACEANHADGDPHGTRAVSQELRRVGAAARLEYTRGVDIRTGLACMVIIGAQP